MFYKFLYASKSDLFKAIVLYSLALLFLLVTLFQKNNSKSQIEMAAIIPLSADTIKENKYHWSFFNPNQIDSSTLGAFGLNPKEIQTYFNFKSRIKIFKEPAQLNKLYIKNELKDSLLKYAIFNKSESYQDKESKGSIGFKIKQNNSIAIFSVDLNKSTADSLKKIRGIGNILSDRIVSYGSALGGYVDLSQLKEVYHYPKEQHDEIVKNLFVAKDFVPKKLDVNKGSFKELLAHPYLDYEMVKQIFNEKDKNGDYKSWGEFKKRVLMKEETYIKLAPYFKFE